MRAKKPPVKPGTKYKRQGTEANEYPPAHRPGAFKRKELSTKDTKVARNIKRLFTMNVI